MKLIINHFIFIKRNLINFWLEMNFINFEKYIFLIEKKWEKKIK